MVCLYRVECGYCAEAFSATSPRAIVCHRCVEALELRELWQLDTMIAFWEGPDVVQRLAVIDAVRDFRARRYPPFAELMKPVDLTDADLTRLHDEAMAAGEALGPESVGNPDAKLIR